MVTELCEGGDLEQYLKVHTGLGSTQGIWPSLRCQFVRMPHPA